MAGSRVVRDSKFLKKRAEDMVSQIKPYILESDRILDIGCGGCHIAKNLKDEGYDVTPLDVKDKSCFEDVRPIIYDGENIPFENNSFSVSLLLTVLHHTRYPACVLGEAKRVSKRIIIIEDLYDGLFQKYLTFIMDSILNMEFFGHPHSNKTKEEWETLFEEIGLKILDQKSHTFWRFFTSGIFYLERL